jgi:hypothetical protein
LLRAIVRPDYEYILVRGVIECGFNLQGLIRPFVDPEHVLGREVSLKVSRYRHAPGLELHLFLDGVDCSRDSL